MTDKKNHYQNPEIEIIDLTMTDIITTSDGNDIDIDHGENDGEWM